MALSSQQQTLFTTIASQIHTLLQSGTTDPTPDVLAITGFDKLTQTQKDQVVNMLLYLLYALLDSGKADSNFSFLTGQAGISRTITIPTVGSITVTNGIITGTTIP